MLRVPIDRVAPGMVLARPLLSPWNPNELLLPRDLELPADIAPRLREWGVTEIWVRCRELDFLDDVIDEEVSEGQRVVYHQVRRHFESLMRGHSAGVDAEHYTAAIGDLFQTLRRTAHGPLLLEKLDAFDNYLLAHSANVCYLALLLGLKLEAEERAVSGAGFADAPQALRELGLGCILHDVGKMRVPPEILHKPGKLSPAEMEVMQRHPVDGYGMVAGRISSAAAEVVLHHHQRYAGGGYPCVPDPASGGEAPLAGERIPLLARIATLCDVYDAATTNRCYSAAKPAVQALFEMRTFCRGFFDPVCARVFYEIVPPFPIGQRVGLSNGAEAVVVDFNPRQPVRPKLQGLRDPYGDPAVEEMDLAERLDLSIVTVEGRDVARFTAVQEAGLPQPALV